MSVDNRTPFPAIAFRQYNLAGEMLGVVAMRGTFLLQMDGPLVPAKEQHGLVLADMYDGDPHDGPLICQADLTPFKPGTDITFLGAAHSPDQAPRPSWNCRIRVGAVEKSLRVTGPRKWRARQRQAWKGLIDSAHEYKLAGWDLTQPEPVHYVPMDWRLAYGGLLPGQSGKSPNGRYRFNSLGRGIVDDSLFHEVSEYPAPQIEDPAHPLTSPHGDIVPQGFGPLAPWWDQRHQYAGTYSDEWLKNRHPLLPEDFDFRFWQCAHPDLIAEPWLNGDEDYELENLAFKYPLIRGQLPSLNMRMTLDQGRGPETAPMVLDGVQFDLRPGVGRVYLTWRTAFPWPDRRGLPIIECLSGMAEAA